MRVPDEQPAARAQQRRDHAGPPVDVGQPAQRTDAGVDEVERRRIEHRGGVVHVGLDESDHGTGSHRPGRGHAAMALADEKSRPIM